MTTDRIKQDRERLGAEEILSHPQLKFSYDRIKQDIYKLFRLTSKLNLYTCSTIKPDNIRLSKELDSIQQQLETIQHSIHISNQKKGGGVSV